MEDEIQKRNTDCVYFLASPLTCKKGIECEYRHSDSARLNPRDCWYWLSGNCLNPTCAFRHPPLEAHTEALSDPTAPPHQSSVPANKTNVPCYFYFSGYCNKGDRCSFLHGPPNGVNSGSKSTKTSGVVTYVHPTENKASTGTDAGTASIAALPNPSEIISEPVLSIQSGDNKKAVPSTFVEQSPSPEISVPECEEARVKSENPPPTEDFIEVRSPSCQGQSSEEHADGPIEREEWWESSPGFDVLVDDGSENLGYEEDPEYVLAHDGDATELHNHLLQYDYEDPAGYDPMEYTDAGNLYKHGHYDSYEHLEDDNVSDYVRIGPDLSREGMVDPILFQKRKFLPRDPEMDGKNGVDLRDRLRKRRRIDGRLMSRNPRRHGSSHLNDRTRERPGRHGMGNPLHGRLASEVGKNMIGSHGDVVAGPNDNHRGSSFRHLQVRHNRLRHRERERRRQGRPEFLHSELSRSTAPRDRNMQESSKFNGPKTLAQIREEKRKVRENKNGFGSTAAHSNRATSVDFQGPKPLSEILKDKRKQWSADDENASGRSKHGNGEPDKKHDYRNKDKHDYRNKDEYFDEDDEDEDEDEDDDGLEKKLATIFS